MPLGGGGSTQTLAPSSGITQGGMFGGYSQQEFDKAGITLIPVQGKKIKFEDSWIPALNAARLSLANASLDAMQTEAQKAADLVKSNAKKMTGRAATILTSPLGVTSPAPVQQKTLLGQ